MHSCLINGARFLNRHNLSKITFHQLSHTNECLLISSNEGIVSISGRLRSADKNVTLNTNSHMIKSKEVQVANKMNKFYSTLNFKKYPECSYKKRFRLRPQYFLLY